MTTTPTARRKAENMNAAEKLKAAIEKLEAMKAMDWPCAEYTRKAVRHISRNCEIDCDNEEHECGWDRYETGPAIFTLSQTIDPQLAILRDDYETCVRNNWIPDRKVLALAEVILGGAGA
jgi:hypothetical protein